MRPHFFVSSALAAAAILLVFVPQTLRAQGAAHSSRDTVATRPGVLAVGDSVTVRLVDVDIRTAIQSLAPYLDRPVAFGQMNQARITFQSPRPIPQADIPKLLRGLLESQGLELAADTVAGMYRVRTKEPVRVVPATISVPNAQ